MIGLVILLISAANFIHSWFGTASTDGKRAPAISRIAAGAKAHHRGGLERSVGRRAINASMPPTVRPKERFDGPSGVSSRLKVSCTFACIGRLHFAVYTV